MHVRVQARQRRLYPLCCNDRMTASLTAKSPESHGRGHSDAHTRLSSVSTLFLSLLQLPTSSPRPPPQTPHNNLACMCWLPVENLKQLTVSPLRPARCLSTAACIETHKKPDPVSKFFSELYPEPLLPSSRVSAGYHSNPSRSLSPSVDLHTDVSAIKARLLLSELPPVDITLPSSPTFLRLEVLFRGGFAQRFSPSALCGVLYPLS